MWSTDVLKNCLNLRASHVTYTRKSVNKQSSFQKQLSKHCRMTKSTVKDPFDLSNMYYFFHTAFMDVNSLVNFQCILQIFNSILTTRISNSF